MWSVGCIMAELFLGVPPFQGKAEIEQLDLIFRGIGSPTEETWPNVKEFENYLYVSGKKYSEGQLQERLQSSKKGISSEGLQLLKGLLTANPKKRLTARKALQHSWLKGTMSARESMPQLPPMNELDRVARKKLKTASQA